MTPDLQELTRKIIAFRDERNWQQFHNRKDLALVSFETRDEIPIATLGQGQMPPVPQPA